MNNIRLAILVLILWNIPSYMLVFWGSTLGSITSYATSLFLLLFFFLAKPKHKLLLPFIYLGVLFYTFASLNFSNEMEDVFIKEFLRFMILVVCAGEVFHRTTKKELYIILGIGALSIIVNALIFPTANADFNPTYGRFSGFYLNPNYAGAVCIIGYAISFSMKNKWLRIIGQLTFTLAGILTFSRTFIVIWLVLSAIAIYQNKRNLVAPVIGALVLIFVFAFSGKLTLNKDRFKALSSIFMKGPVESSTITHDGRAATWGIYTGMIMDKPLFGNGFNKLRSRDYGGPGVHNSYLMILGEAGIIPFLIFIGIYIHLFIQALKNFKTHPEYFYIIVTLLLALSTGHGYLRVYFNVFISMYLFVAFKKIAQNQESAKLVEHEDQ